MDNYKVACFEKVRIQTGKGLLSTEQLCDLSIDDLDALAVSLEIEHQQSGKKSFIGKTSAKDKLAKLKFDLVLDILNTKMEQMQAAAEKKERDDHNKKIIGLIAEKQDESLKNKSIKDLQKMLK
jgi:hypothetical protein